MPVYTGFHPLIREARPDDFHAAMLSLLRPLLLEDHELTVFSRLASHQPDQPEPLRHGVLVWWNTVPAGKEA